MLALSVGNWAINSAMHRESKHIAGDHCLNNFMCVLLNIISFSTVQPMSQCCLLDPFLQNHCSSYAAGQILIQYEGMKQRPHVTVLARTWFDIQLSTTNMLFKSHLTPPELSYTMLHPEVGDPTPGQVQRASVWDQHRTRSPRIRKTSRTIRRFEE